MALSQGNKALFSDYDGIKKLIDNFLGQSTVNSAYPYAAQPNPYQAGSLIRKASV